jgi:hypothetical protein
MDDWLTNVGSGVVEERGLGVEEEASLDLVRRVAAVVPRGRHPVVPEHRQQNVSSSSAWTTPLNNRNINTRHRLQNTGVP